jgi:putative membrane protein
MFIDYVTLMLINMVGGLFVLAVFICKDIDNENNHFWAPAFALPGLIAVVCGFAMTFSSPIPKPYSSAYGETSVLLGSLFLAAAWSLAKGWRLFPLGIYAFFAGLVGVLIGIRIITLGLTKMPLLAGVGFILTGSGGVFAELVILARRTKWLRVLAALILVGAALIWALTACMAYWMHLHVTTT